MNNRFLSLLALGMALLLHFLLIAPIFMQKKADILLLQEQNAPKTEQLHVQQIPLPSPQISVEPEEIAAKEEESEEAPPEDEPLTINEEYQPEQSETPEPDFPELEPPAENERYSRTFVANATKEQELIERAAAALNETPYLSDAWFKDALFNEPNAGIESEDGEILEAENNEESEETPQEQLLKSSEEAKLPEPSEHALESEQDATSSEALIVTFLDLAKFEKLQEELEREEKEAQKAAEVQATANLIAAVKGGNIQPPDEIESIAQECYPQEMAKLGRGRQAHLLILENPLRVALYKGSGISKLDSCALQIADRMIRDPQELNAIRRGAPRVNGGYLIRASF